MNKIWIIIKREFLTRVRKKSFIVTTLLLPIFFAAMIILPGVFISSDNDEKVAVIDESGYFAGKLPDEKGIHYTFVDAKVDTFKKSYRNQGYTGLLHIPKLDLNRLPAFVYYSKGQMPFSLRGSMEKRLESVVEDKRMEAAGIDKSKLEDIRADINIENLAGEAEKKGSSTVAYIVGWVAGFLIYIVLLVFGMMVMRGVMEEKTNRIAEVMVSSVKPFQLMMGKIVGIAGVGLLQFIIWTGIMILLNTLLLPLLGGDTEVAAGTQMSGSAKFTEQIALAMASIDWFTLLPLFLFYFLGGYLFYAALFAAVGSLVNEDPNDAQSLTFPITLPIIVAIIIMIQAVVNPTSPLAVWGSIIPFTSPVVMMARIPYGVPGTVPYWQLGLSMVSLIAGFLGTTWVAAKIYRTGILMYGKKVTLGEVGKWIFKKS
ncbi:ABC transporter permease [Chitinophaga sp.]|uniref:ABC transporter permease n=1 Tax=Chitinophaga sp. TaxID=1869181 RepID=UPI002620021D|nr:ABC transporter permease [uncultured Chitinophaga sp.]